ncbi:MAG: aromatic amino acid transport family protein [Chlamydiota bacterium]
MKYFHKNHHLVGGTLLVAGTSIGVGMLALPVATAAGGFFPAIGIYIIAWIFMVAIGLLILEACIWCPKDANLITLSRTLLGSKGAAACWILYLFLLYCLMVAHTAIGGSAIKEIGLPGPDWLFAALYVAVFAPVVYLGTQWVDRLNVLLMLGLILTFFLFFFSSFDQIQPTLLLRMNWSKAWLALPVVVTAFGFQTLIPTLMTYMERDHKKVRKAIWLGTSIPLILYSIWELIILGIIPLDLLLDAAKLGENAVIPLQNAVQKGTLGKIGELFAFFAMTTSFIGLSLAFFDFWADGLNWEKKGLKKIGLCALVFLIPLCIVFVDPEIFLKALNLAGGIGVALLFGVLPVLLVWSGRYSLKHSSLHVQLGGGKALLALLLLFSLFMMIMGFIS